MNTSSEGASISELVLTEQDIEALTGYAIATKQLRVLHNRGFHRAYINRRGEVVLERAHFESVSRGESQGSALGSKAANLAFLRQKRAA